MVKVLVDGVVSPLHTHDGTHLEVVADRLSERLHVSPAELAALLTHNPAGVLGARRLPWPFRRSVRWNPADDLLVYRRVASESSPTWRLSAALIEVTAAAARAEAPRRSIPPQRRNGTAIRGGGCPSPPVPGRAGASARVTRPTA